jgi:hypothetical protein
LSNVSPKFATIDDWCTISGMSRRITYDKIGTGALKAVKAGTRTLIDVEAGLTWLRALPPAKARPDRRSNHRAQHEQAAA